MRRKRCWKLPCWQRSSENRSAMNSGNRLKKLFASCRQQAADLLGNIEPFVCFVGKRRQEVAPGARQHYASRNNNGPDYRQQRMVSGEFLNVDLQCFRQQHDSRSSYLRQNLQHSFVKIRRKSYTWQPRILLTEDWYPFRGQLSWTPFSRPTQVRKMSLQRRPVHRACRGRR